VSRSTTLKTMNAWSYTLLSVNVTRALGQSYLAACRFVYALFF